MKKARYHGIPCWFNPVTNEIIGRTLFYDLLIDLVLSIDQFFCDEFKVTIE